MSERDHYEVLGIPRDANYAAIDAAYWSKVKEARNDPGLDPDVIASLNEAYEILRTPLLRGEYNAARVAKALEAPAAGADELAPANSATEGESAGLASRLHRGRRANEERAAETAAMVGRLEREVRGDRERMRAELEAELDRDERSDDTERSPLMRLFGDLRQS